MAPGLNRPEWTKMDEVPKPKSQAGKWLLGGILYFFSFGPVEALIAKETIPEFITPLFQIIYAPVSLLCLIPFVGDAIFAYVMVWGSVFGLPTPPI